jgi:hypothetical protein
LSIAFPYRTPSNDAVQPGAWLMRRRDDFVPVPPMMPDWDSSTDLTFRREVVVDRLVFAEETGLSSDDLHLELVVQWRVSDSLLTGIAFRAGIGEASTSVNAEFTLQGRLLGGTLQLTSAIMLRDSIDDNAGPTARHAGSILWRDSAKRVRLTGEASRLPITKVDFRNHQIDQSAPWAVRIDGDLENPAMGAIQLLLNVRRDDVIELLESRTEHEIAARAIRSALYVAVGRALLERAILDEDLTDDAEYADDTLGAVLLGQLHLRFPGRTLTDLRALRENEPARFSAWVEGKYGLFKEVVP